jgi:hypothetical protein
MEIYPLLFIKYIFYNNQLGTIFLSNVLIKTKQTNKLLLIF